MTGIIDLPNPFESAGAPAAVSPAAAALLPQPDAAAVGTSPAEVVPTSAPGMARSDSDVLEIPPFLRRDGNNRSPMFVGVDLASGPDLCVEQVISNSNFVNSEA